MYTEKHKKTSHLKDLIKLENNDIENMTNQQQFNFANEITYFRNEIIELLEKNEKLSEVDKEFAYNYSTIEQRTYLVNKYPTYFEDFYFLDQYTMYRTTLENEHKVPVYINPSDKSIIENFHSKFNINDLKHFFKDWNSSIFKNDKLNKDPDKLKIAIKKVVNKQLFDFNNDLKKCNKVINTDDLINSDYFMLILHSKWVYLTSKKIVETYKNGKNYYKLNLNNVACRFTLDSLIHILIRHYSYLSKIAESYKNEVNCSNHNENVHFEEIHLVLENIFKIIDNSQIIITNNLVKNIVIENQQITFKFKGTIYRVWFSFNKNENESGRTPFIKIESFYPLTRKSDLKTLNSDYRIMKINNDLSVYTEKHIILKIFTKIKLYLLKYIFLLEYNS